MLQDISAKCLDAPKSSVKSTGHLRMDSYRRFSNLTKCFKTAFVMNELSFRVKDLDMEVSYQDSGALRWLSGRNTYTFSLSRFFRCIMGLVQQSLPTVILILLPVATCLPTLYAATLG